MAYTGFENGSVVVGAQIANAQMVNAQMELWKNAHSSAIESSSTAPVGIGVMLNDYADLDIGSDRVGVVVRGTLPGSPAQAAGVMAGDQVIAVNDIDVTEVDAQAVQRLISDATRSPIDLQLRRGEEPLTVVVAPDVLDAVDQPIPLRNASGEAFSNVWLQLTERISDCEQTQQSAIYSEVRFLAPISPSVGRQVLISNARTGGYLTRQYTGMQGSSPFDLSLADSHSDQYLAVLPGENILTYQVFESGAEVGSATFLLAVRQEVEEVLQPATSAPLQQDCFAPPVPPCETFGAPGICEDFFPEQMPEQP